MPDSQEIKSTHSKFVSHQLVQQRLEQIFEHHPFR